MLSVVHHEDFQCENSPFFCQNEKKIRSSITLPDSVQDDFIFFNLAKNCAGRYGLMSRVKRVLGACLQKIEEAVCR